LRVGQVDCTFTAWRASLPIRYDIIYDLFIAAVHAHTFVIEEQDILFIFNLSIYLEVVLDVWMLFHMPLSRAQQFGREGGTETVTYYDREEEAAAAEEEEEEEEEEKGVFMRGRSWHVGILAS
jgi:hypothetical protein